MITYWNMPLWDLVKANFDISAATFVRIVLPGVVLLITIVIASGLALHWKTWKGRTKK